MVPVPPVRHNFSDPDQTTAWESRLGPTGAVSAGRTHLRAQFFAKLDLNSIFGPKPAKNRLCTAKKRLLTVDSEALLVHAAQSWANLEVHQSSEWSETFSSPVIAHADPFLVSLGFGAKTVENGPYLEN